jgi:hypothetical protein
MNQELMMQKSRIVLFAAACLSAVGIVLIWQPAFSATDDKPAAKPKLDAQPKLPEKTEVQKFMREKLTASQDIVEGLVTEDYAIIVSGAERLLKMSKATEWHVIQGPIFAQHSAEFRRTVEKLIKTAKDRNIDGASLTYMHMTMTCIDCHKFVRSTHVALR